MQTVFIKMLLALLLITVQKGIGQNNTGLKTQYVVICKDKIAYRSQGNGAPILLAHRLWGTLDTWDPLFLQQLSASHQVITFDFPGIGYSTGTLPADFKVTAGYMKELVKALHLKEATVLGWSYGGFIAQVAAPEYPEVFTKAILIGTNPPGNNAVAIQPAFLERSSKPVNSLEEEIVMFFEPGSSASQQAARFSHDRIYKTADMSKIPGQHILQFYTAGHFNFVEDKSNYRSKLKSSKVPMLIISGDNDISMAAENWFALLHDMPTAQILTLPQSGHGTHHQYPELTAKYIAGFISH